MELAFEFFNTKGGQGPHLKFFTKYYSLRKLYLIVDQIVVQLRWTPSTTTQEFMVEFCNRSL
jgi:hypothetical protein